MKSQFDLFSANNVASKTIRIHFDGGAKGSGCVPGTGWGYGSYTINNGSVRRVDHNAVMTAQAAEVLTLCEALKEVCGSCDPSTVKLTILGDSTTTLYKVRAITSSRKKVKLRGSEGFQESVKLLSDLILRFAEVETEWKSREHAVRAFGH
jgi:ribonuclease HI